MRATAVVERFDRDGYALIEGLLASDQLARAQQGVEWAMAQPMERYKWIKQRTYEWFRDHPIFVEIIEDALVLDFCEQWLGPQFHLIAAQCSRNTRDDHYAPGVMKLHRDSGLFPHEERRAAGVPVQRYGFSAMWYLQDTPLEMGPTELVRGGHTSTTNYGEVEPAPELLFRQAIPAGSLLLFSHYTWHRGALNQTPRPRDLITNAYARPEIEKSHLLTPRAGGEDAYEPPEELLLSGTDAMRRLLAQPEAISR